MQSVKIGTSTWQNIVFVIVCVATAVYEALQSAPNGAITVGALIAAAISGAATAISRGSQAKALTWQQQVEAPPES